MTKQTNTKPAQPASELKLHADKWHNGYSEPTCFRCRELIAKERPAHES